MLSLMISQNHFVIFQQYKFTIGDPELEVLVAIKWA